MGNPASIEVSPQEANRGFTDTIHTLKINDTTFNRGIPSKTAEMIEQQIKIHNPIKDGQITAVLYNYLVAGGYAPAALFDILPGSEIDSDRPDQ